MIQRPDNRFFMAMLVLFMSLLFAIYFCSISSRAEVKQVNEYTSVVDTMTDKEYSELIRVMFLECRSEPFQGKVAVAEIVFNRVLSDYFPDTVHDVLSQRGQFATWHYIDKVDSIDEYNKEESMQEIRDAINYAYYNGRSVLPSEKYVYFDTSGKNGTNHFHIANHYFGKMK